MDRHLNGLSILPEDPSISVVRIRSTTKLVPDLAKSHRLQKSFGVSQAC
jgi:hypothetical protein